MINPRVSTWRRWSRVGLAWLLLGVVGCGFDEVETAYGKSRGKSINGTNALAELIRGRGHTVRTAVRYNEVLGEWADTIVRFSPHPGPPARQEAEWLADWLGEAPGRQVIYIPRDYDAAPEFWAQMRAALPRDTPQGERQKVESRQAAAGDWARDLPPPSRQPASVDDWFGTEAGVVTKPDAVEVCRELTGPWAEGVDPKAAAIPRRQILRAENDERVFLAGDGKKLVVGWTFGGEGEDESVSSVLVIANGSFLVNGGLLTRGRRPLTIRLVDWIGDDARRVAFVEGSRVLADLDETAAASPFHLLTVEPFNWIAAHLGAFGVLFCLSLAVRIGRPRAEPAGEVERPSAHPIALGAILARTRRDDLAADLLEDYRRWRQSSSAPPRPGSPTPRRAPRP